MDTGLDTTNLEYLAEGLLKCDRHIQLVDLSENPNAYDGLAYFAQKIAQRKYPISIVDLQCTDDLDCLDDPNCLDGIIQAFEPLCTYPRKVGRLIMGDIDRTFREM
jgi:hypothetical protein